MTNMTTEQAPGIPWHDHEWVNVTVMGDTEEHFICVFYPKSVAGKRIPGSPTRCPAQRSVPIPEPPEMCPTCGRPVYAP